MITPTVGRIVLYFEASRPAQPLAALVAAVNVDGTLNLAYADSTGEMFAVQSVYLKQDGVTPPAKLIDWAEWMPYQKAVAAGTIPPALHAVPAGKAS